MNEIKSWELSVQIWKDTDSDDCYYWSVIEMFDRGEEQVTDYGEADDYFQALRAAKRAVIGLF